MTEYEIGGDVTIEKLCQELKAHMVIKVRSCRKECKEAQCWTYAYITKVKDNVIRGLVMDKSPINEEGHMVFTAMKCYIDNLGNRIIFNQDCNRNFSTGWSVSFIEVVPITIDTIKTK